MLFSAIKKAFSEATGALFSSDSITVQKTSALWISLSIGSLMLAGFLSIFIMLGRTPVIYKLISDPHWFRRMLVVHVDLALLVWFYGFLCGLFALIPHPESKNKQPVAGFLSGVIGVILITVSIFITSAGPVLSNYIPVLNHPVFIAGIIFFAVGVGLTLFNKRLFTRTASRELPSILPASAVPGLRSAAVIFLVSLVVFITAWLNTSNSYSAENYYEFIIWGGGHLLQFVNIAMAVVVWLLLMKKLTGRDAIKRRWSRLLFLIFTLPVMASPLLLINGTSSSLYLNGFTRYMQWRIFPVISIFMVLFVVHVIRAGKQHKLPSSPGRSPYLNGFVLSILFIILSFGLGILIQGSNTIVPAHYHASLGGITIAFMVAVYLLMDFYEMPAPNAKVERWEAVQPLLFGIGQAIFVSGLAYAGAYGLARKVFGAEQQINSVEVYIGLSLLFIGGTLAIAGGILFFGIVIKRWNAYHSQQHNNDSNGKSRKEYSSALPDATDNEPTIVSFTPDN